MFLSLFRYDAQDPFEGKKMRKRNRAIIFAQFLKDTFGAMDTVVDVAGGEGCSHLFAFVWEYLL